MPPGRRHHRGPDHREPEHRAANLDAEGTVIPGITRDGEIIGGTGDGEPGTATPNTGAPEHGRDSRATGGVAQAGAQEVGAALPDAPETMRKVRTATLSLDAALAYCRARRGEGGLSAAVSSHDSHATAERDGDAIRVRWQVGEASAMARHETNRRAEEARAARTDALTRLREEKAREDAALERLLGAIEGQAGLDAEGREGAKAGARGAHASYARSLDRRIAEEEARWCRHPGGISGTTGSPLEGDAAKMAAPPVAAPLDEEIRGGEHRLALDGSVTLKII